MCCALLLVIATVDGKPAPKYKKKAGGVPPPGQQDAPADVPPADAVVSELPPGAEVMDKKYSEYLNDEEKTSGICEQYCENPCSQFAWGSDTIKECNGCDDSKKCHPGAEHYGDEWIAKHPEL